jgi:hypothetical protein
MGIVRSVDFLDDDEQPAALPQQDPQAHGETSESNDEVDKTEAEAEAEGVEQANSSGNPVEVEDVQVTLTPAANTLAEQSAEQLPPDNIEHPQAAEDRKADVVQQSLEMYYSQRTQSSHPSYPSSTEKSLQPTAASSQASSSTSITKPLYWSEAMDIQLAKLVSAHAFDFDAVSEALAAMATAGQFEHDVPSEELAARLTSEICRLRWADLDAQVRAAACLVGSAEAHMV